MATNQTTSQTARVSRGFSTDALARANVGTEWEQRRSLMPFRSGQQVVERVGSRSYISAVIDHDDHAVLTSRGNTYSRIGTSLMRDNRARSLTSPSYVLRAMLAVEGRSK